MRRLVEMLPQHASDLGNVTIHEMQAFVEILRQAWPKNELTFVVGEGHEVRRSVYALLGDEEAARLFRDVLLGLVVERASGASWIALADRRTQRYARHS